MTEQSRYASLRDYLRVLRRQAWVIAVVALVGAAVALGLSLREANVYDAMASISFEADASALELLGDGTAPNNSPPAQTPQARAQTIVDSATVEAVAESLGRPEDRAAFASAISTDLDEGTFLVDVTASWSSPEFAARLANQFVRQAARTVNLEARKDFRSTLREVRSRINSLDSSNADDAASRASLVAQEVRLTFLSKNSTPATVATKATPPGTPVSPRPVRNTALGLLFGLVLGLVAAFVRDSLDRRLRGADEIQQEAAYPIVGHLRSDALGSVLRAGVESSFVDGVEQVRILRQNIRFLDVDAELKKILITSALPEEGKSTVASSLAFASAAQGEDVLLLECDLRRPTLAGRVDVPSAPGLADHLVSEADVGEIFRILTLQAGSPMHLNGFGVGEENGDQEGALSYVPAGTISSYPAELLQSDRFKSFFEAVAGTFDTVIVDSSPLLPVADTLELIPHVDCILLCVRSGQSDREALKSARRVLEHYPTKPTGLVVTGLSHRDMREYGYYGYGSYEPYAAAAAAARSDDA